MADSVLDLFTLATLRVPQPPTGQFPSVKLLDDRVIHGQGTGNVSMTNEDTPYTRLDDPGLNDGPPVGAFDRWLSERQDQLTLQEALEFFVQQEIVLGSMVREDWYTSIRSRVHASFLVLVARRPEPEDAVDVARGRTEMLRATRLMALMEELADAGTRTPEQLHWFLTSSIILLPDWFRRPADQLARPPMIADLKVVRLGPPAYEPGVISYIENVMATENRQRTFRVIEEFESTDTEETETTTEREQDLTTTSALELMQETTKAVKELANFEAGVNISASYGPYVKVDSNVKYAQQSSREESNRASVSFSNQITKRARELVIERTLRRRTSRHLQRTDETNAHGFDNSQNDQHVVGVYRAVDSVQQAWIENYGKRLMLEFMIPEPSAFVRWVQSRPATQLPLRNEPPAPQIDGRSLSPADITPENYLSLVAANRVDGVTPPPAPTIALAITVKAEGNSDLYTAQDKSLKVPDGYRAVKWRATLLTWGASSPDGEVWMVGVGGGPPQVTDSTNHPELARNITGDLDLASGSEIPVVMLGRGLINFSASVELECQVAAALAKWQLEVYEAVIEAWHKDHENWAAEKARAEAQAALRSQPTFETVGGAAGDIERRELRRGVITFLLAESPSGGVFSGAAVVPGDQEKGPTYDFATAAAERDWISFLEQGFEWANMTWVYYPYYWASEDRWAGDALRSSPDPLWNAFLTAGSARVVVPVRPGFESAMCLFLATGLIWDGGTAPTIGDPAYVGIAEELAESLGANNGVPKERRDLAPVRLPTSLVWLQKDAEIGPKSEDAPLLASRAPSLGIS